MKTAIVSIRPGKWANVSFALPVFVTPEGGRTPRNHAPAGRWDACKNRKGIAMKNLSKSRRLCLASPCALCVSMLIAWSGIAVQAETGSPTKGSGAELLVKPVRPPAASNETGSKAMPVSCPKCKSEWFSHPDYTARGAVKPTVWLEKHLCERCATTITVAGVGRGKHAVAVHKCTTCGAPNQGCCSTGKSGGGAKGTN